MKTSLDVEGVVVHIKEIVEHVRCAICGSDGGTRVRYGCGHAACGRCSAATRHCAQCSRASRASRPAADLALSARAANALALLAAFQETCTDRHRRRELAQKLRAEKALFPACIQAPRKYCNRRTRSDLREDPSLGRVREWLERSRRATEAGPRLPLRDLDANDPATDKDRLAWLAVLGRAAATPPVPFYQRSSLRGEACARCGRASGDAATVSVGVQAQAGAVVTVAEVHAPPGRGTRGGSSDKENRDPNAVPSAPSTAKRKKRDKPSSLRRTLL